jgi:hypothetical protein
MTTAAEWMNPVKASGMAAYLVASLSCGVALVTAGNKRISRLAAFLGILHAALFFDIAFDWRWKLYGWLQSQVVAQQWYGQRHWPQVGMLVILAALLLVGVIAAWRRFPSPPGAVLALDGSLLSIGCWSTEVISLHATDSILYHRAGPLMIISFVWILACMMTVIGISKAGRRKRGAGNRNIL